ncbi:MAG: PKD domain-containing protein [Bacteroidetes bacterium]|nr:PKD domain-containing protein [Bacteroidota bacterium]
MKQFKKYSWAILVLAVLTLTYSCKKDKTTPPVAGFTHSQDAANFLQFTFTNSSTNADTYSWNFGDGTAAVTDKDPVHTFPAAGTYTVVLTATAGGSSDAYQEVITVSDPNAMLTALAGSTTKTWKLLRDVSGGVYPLEVGPWDHSSIWWAMGKGNDELANRPCLLNDEFTFGRDGSYVIDRKGDYWAEGGIYNPSNVCASTSTMVGVNGEDLSAWGGGTFTFTLDPGAKKITSVGKGAYIGFEKLGNGAEVMNGTSATNPITPPASVTYDIISLYDGAVDTLIVQGHYTWDATDGGYWRFVLVHYDDPSQEPPIPGNKPAVGFNLDISGLTVTCNNTSTGGVTYAWTFGDGTSSTAQSPSHTYAEGGPYVVTLTASNPNGDATTSSAIFVTQDVVTDANLQGGAWKVKVDNLTVFVGDGMGKSNWWSVPVDFLNGGKVGTTDDWSCMPDDEFTFSAGGVFTYNTKGSTRNDGYFGGTNGCIDDAGILASGNGAAFASGSHTYTFTPPTASTRALITLTSTAGHAAFIGFYKGYNGVASGMPGGENSDKTIAANGGSPTNTYEVMGYAKTATKEYLFVSVDFTADHSGHGWSAILER